jgi:hypothetical protein
MIHVVRTRVEIPLELHCPVAGAVVVYRVLPCHVLVEPPVANSNGVRFDHRRSYVVLRHDVVSDHSVRDPHVELRRDVIEGLVLVCAQAVG